MPPQLELPDFYQLEVKFTVGYIGRFVARSEIISSLYERAYKECMHQLYGWVEALSAPCVYDKQLIERDRKFMILGPGRSGTTFLVKLLTRLDLYTGYYPYREIEVPNTRAGCEFGIFSFGEINRYLREDATKFDPEHIEEVQEEFKYAPFLIKSPAYSWYVKILVTHYKIPMGHILVPIRDHREVARSRIGEGLELALVGKDYNSQLTACDILLGKVVETAILHDIPLTFMKFPEIILDEGYCWDVLNKILTETFDIHLDRNRFREEYNKLADPSLVKYSVRDLV